MDASTTPKHSITCTSPHGHSADIQAPTHDKGGRNTAPKSNAKQAKVMLRDAKQVLAEQAEERMRQKQKKALESPKVRKSTRKPSKKKAKTTKSTVNKVCNNLANFFKR